MERFQELIHTLDSYIWGEYLLIPLLTLVGVYLTIGLRAMPWRRFPQALKQLWQGRLKDDKEGDISPFQALMTELSATIGTGNIAGVATAIYFGGPGAIFWMWVIALFGMATKYAEGLLAVKYREVDSLGQHVGGPMYYIKNGLGKRWYWLGAIFAFFGMCAAFGIGNMVQSNSLADELHTTFAIPLWVTGVVLATLAGAVILGGIKRIAEVAGKLVPLMGIAYFTGALIILLIHFKQVPHALAMIVTDAFTGTAASGGFAGATIWMALRWGFARGIFSNEAGLGSTPIAHAAARTDDPVKQGMIAMLGPLIDTLIICTMTALVIITTGVWNSGETGAPLSSLAFNTGLPGPGGYIVSFGLMIFAFTTILGWSYYGERCAEYLFGTGIILPYRIAWLIAVITGAVTKLNLVWTLADVMNGLMAMPNLIALLLLSPVVFSMTRQRLRKAVD
ncbi:MAG: sodium:alanine symporter family protein [Gammaproteobacteria bacterium]|nr:amino acid carrier protein [Gammaproteobacteria bacterium]NIN62227.1 amino acid carrier protein [Gammaproteobacteria bacterium]NIO62238.1 amino acid carrier protein [Gammaproteobacteria bacterium]NIP48758.1 sodium:alanine symporter family protein [Gammaproteobacteria bacterium]NIQ09212.1 sodium:alanine symporter family protein [Gammaproteobacteria bacterium]